MKIHLNETEIKEAIMARYVGPVISNDHFDEEGDPKITIDLKATRGVEGMTCDIVIGTDQSDKPLGIQRVVETARAEPTTTLHEHLTQDEEHVQMQDTRPAPEKTVQSDPTAQGTEQAPETPKRRGRPPGSKNKATLEAEAKAAANNTGDGPAPEEVAETVQDEERPEPTPYVKSGGLFANRQKTEPTEEAPASAANEEPETEDQEADGPEDGPEDEEAQLAAEAQRTEPQEEQPAQEETPKPTRSLFANLSRAKNDG